jgi:histidinol-phosphate aminotransferase
MSPKARATLEATADEGARYPDGNGFVLKEAIARKFGVAPERLVLGNGSNDVLELAARIVLQPGAEAVYSQYAFAVYPLVTQALGARPVEVPAKDYGHDLEAMLGAITPRTRIVFLANPNNPTGTFVPGEALESFLARVPEDVLVVLDEAYGEYLDPAERYESLAWVDRFPNLLVCRTFSKIYGLASLRVGYGVARPELVDVINRIRQPFNVNAFALEAAAAALEDEAFVARSAELNRQGLRQLYEGFARLGLRWVPSRGNFVMVHVGDAGAVNEELLDRGVIVRPIAGYGLPEWLRVTVGLPEENARFLDALADILRT